MNRLATLFRITALIVFLVLSGCGGESFTYESDHELKPGPGLFSGKDGKFTLVDSSRKNGTEQDQKEEKEAGIIE